MDARILVARAAARAQFIDIHLSTLNGLHVIPVTERDFGNVFQSTIRGRWESPGVFHCVTGERLFVHADSLVRWGVDASNRLRQFQW